MSTSLEVHDFVGSNKRLNEEEDLTHISLLSSDDEEMDEPDKQLKSKSSDMMPSSFLSDFKSDSFISVNDENSLNINSPITQRITRTIAEQVAKSSSKVNDAKIDRGDNAKHSETFSRALDKDLGEETAMYSIFDKYLNLKRKSDAANAAQKLENSYKNVDSLLTDHVCFSVALLLNLLCSC